MVESHLSRRSVLLGGAVALGGAALGGSLLSPVGANAATLPAGPAGRRLADPFTLGVASGDPSSDGMVLWTRLAPTPLSADGRGGMPNRPVTVRWQLASDEKFKHVVRSGSVQARPESAHSVHIEPHGLRPGAEYFYRFRVDGHISRVGRTRTAPDAHTLRTELAMCFASCSNFGTGYFSAYRRMAEDEPHLMLHLGDYQYESGARKGDVREVVGTETIKLADYRLKHAQYKTDADLQFAHATAPWLVVFDDHETENNWADETPEEGSQTPAGPAFMARRAAAFQAYYENMPLRSTARPKGEDMRLYRRVGWGSLATFHMLDTRQYRDDQACGDGVKVGCTERLDKDRSITGETQERWIVDGFNRSRARWDILGQQVFFSQLDLTPGAEHGYNMDAWDGYKANRDRIAHAMGALRNGVVLTGDVHQHWAAEVRSPFGTNKGVGTELVATSITSGGDGDGKANEAALQENEHVKFNINRRGYVRTKFTPGEMHADFRVLPQVTTRGAAASTAASFVVADRDPHLHKR